MIELRLKRGADSASGHARRPGHAQLHVSRDRALATAVLVTGALCLSAGCGNSTPGSAASTRSTQTTGVHYRQQLAGIFKAFAADVHHAQSSFASATNTGARVRGLLMIRDAYLHTATRIARRHPPPAAIDEQAHLVSVLRRGARGIGAGATAMRNGDVARTRWFITRTRRAAAAVRRAIDELVGASYQRPQPH